MQELFADFNSLEDLPEMGQAIPLELISAHPELAALEGQTVLLVEWDNVRAQGRIVRHGNWWYGVVESAIEDIHPAKRTASAS